MQTTTKQRRETFFEEDGIPVLPPAPPQRVESWQSTHSLSESLESALSILKARDVRFEEEENDDDVDEEECDFFSTMNNSRLLPPRDRFNVDLYKPTSFSFCSKGVSPPSLPQRLQSPLIGAGKKSIQEDQRYSALSMRNQMAC